MSADDLDVADLLEDFGQDLTLRRAGTQTYVPATGKVTTGAPITLEVRGAFISRDNYNRDGTLVRGADRHLLITADGLVGAPAIGDTVDGMKISAVRAFVPNGTVVAWDCKLEA